MHHTKMNTSRATTVATTPNVSPCPAVLRDHPALATNMVGVFPETVVLDAKRRTEVFGNCEATGTKLEAVDTFPVIKIDEEGARMLVVIGVTVNPCVLVLSDFSEADVAKIMVVIGITVISCGIVL